MIKIEPLPILEDNYAYLLKADNGETAVLDPGDAAPIIQVLSRQNLPLTHILNTHHHWDHTDGNKQLVEHFGAKLLGPASESGRIDGLTTTLSDNDVFQFGGEDIQIIETPGHTSGGICYHLPHSGAVFTGDTLFVMGTGRLFEGTAEQMFQSLQKLASLPDETLIYCGHEYTLSNAEFSFHIEPGNENIQKRLIEIKALRAQNKPTIPSSIGKEKKTNVFLRAKSPEDFAKIRTLKDNF